MIFVTVGAQMPFDRLIRAVDQWAGQRGRSDVFAQIGTTKLEPCHIDWTHFLPPIEFRKRVEQANLLVAHAGMGSIITGLELGKMILVMPRRGDLQETRNDHQIATAIQFRAQGRVQVAADEIELPIRLDEFTTLSNADATARIGSTAADSLVSALREFIFQEGRI